MSVVVFFVFHTQGRHSRMFYLDRKTASVSEKRTENIQHHFPRGNTTS